MELTEAAINNEPLQITQRIQHNNLGCFHCLSRLNEENLYVRLSIALPGFDIKFHKDLLKKKSLKSRLEYERENEVTIPMLECVNVL